MPIADGRTDWDPLSRLALAVVVQAIRDAREPDVRGMEARTWLLNRGQFWLDVLNIDMPFDYVDWVKAGCASRKQLRRSSTQHTKCKSLAESNCLTSNSPGESGTIKEISYANR